MASVHAPLNLLAGDSPIGFVTPNWFAAVMGTGIVANAAATLPGGAGVPLLAGFARGVWVLDVLLLVALLAATAGHWAGHRSVARRHLGDPVLGHFYGAPAMALLTVGAGALLVGVPVVGAGVAVPVSFALWTAGTVFGLVTAVVLPVLAFSGEGTAPDAAFGGWLMPVVPPMVSAATGPLLLPHLPAGQWRLSLLTVCLMLFGLTLLASVVVITLLWGRLVHHTLPAAATVPTLWIVLGPLGQGATAAHTIGAAAPDVLPAPYAGGVQAMGVVVGLPLLGFALLWLAIAVTVTVRTLRAGLPFTLTWWSFTFPLGTVVTGFSGAAAATGATFLAVFAVVLYVALVAAWATVAVRTAGGTWSGRLLRAPTG